ncbi:Hypothetical predicted protein [Scomber scombrus]|uniref:Uncharacterized protein n=1 Tax=Scomber scombrus TaxID=13677 RepID=A0AAV1N3P6_SCOSC
MKFKGIVKYFLTAKRREELNETRCRTEEPDRSDTPCCEVNLFLLLFMFGCPEKWNEVDGVNYVFFMNLSSLPVTTGVRYELRGKLIYRDVQGGAIIMSSKFEADWMKYVGVRATRGAIPPFCVDHVRPPKNIEFRMRPDVPVGYAAVYLFRC